MPQMMPQLWLMHYTLLFLWLNIIFMLYYYTFWYNMSYDKYQGPKHNKLNLMW